MAVRVRQTGAPAALHSLPNYYGYYIALWTGAPALLLVCVYAVLGSGLVNGVTLSALEREAAPIIRAYLDKWGWEVKRFLPEGMGTEPDDATLARHVDDLPVFEIR